MELFPAIDLSAGKAVRLLRGDYDNMRVYADDPAAVAADFAARGAHNLHLVDLDGAKAGAAVNRAAIARVLETPGLFTEVGGGIRDEARVADYLSLGAGRVILGTAALRDPAFLSAMVKRYAERIAVGVDARDGRVAVSGWLDTTGEDAFAFCQRLMDLGVQTVIYTDIACDGTLLGTNLPAYRRLSTLRGLDVVASGGVSNESEIAALGGMGLYGAIVGKALYEGKLDLARALAVAAGKEPDA